MKRGLDAEPGHPQLSYACVLRPSVRQEPVCAHCALQKAGCIYSHARERLSTTVTGGFDVY
eukprot:scaffold600_cov385-Prasinococcus_capsulatus_cf.AAC.7